MEQTYTVRCSCGKVKMVFNDNEEHEDFGECIVCGEKYAKD
jgi:hypothetical protein